MASRSSRPLPTTKDNVVHPGVTVRSIVIMRDASGAPAVLEYDGYVFRFDQLGELKVGLLAAPEEPDRIASKVARDVLTHAYVTLLEQCTDLAWRVLNIRMYDEAS